MRSKEKLQSASLIGLTVATNFLAACSDRGPTQKDITQALQPNENNALVIKPTEDPYKSLDFQKRIPAPTVAPVPTSTPTPTVPQPKPTIEIDYENSQLLKALENENVDEYVVHWKNFSFGHNLVTVQGLNDLIVKYSRENELPPDVVAGIIFVESNGYDNGNPTTGIGKAGVMPNGPLFPNRPPAEELLDDETNISWGTSILRIILHNENPEVGGKMDMFLSVALYNAGHVDNLFIPTHGWYYARKVFTSIGMAEDFNSYLDRNSIVLE